MKPRATSDVAQGIGRAARRSAICTGWRCRSPRPTPVVAGLDAAGAVGLGSAPRRARMSRRGRTSVGFVEVEDDAAVGGCQLHRALDDGRSAPSSGRASRHDLADLARAPSGRRPSGRVPSCGPALLEQPRVLDGDHGLIGEGLDELDLAIGKRVRRRTDNTNDPYRLALVHQGHGQRRADIAEAWAGVSACSGSVFTSAMWTDRAPTARAPRCSRRRVQPDAGSVLDVGVRCPRCSHEMETAILAELVDEAKIGIAQRARPS